MPESPHTIELTPHARIVLRGDGSVQTRWANGSLYAVPGEGQDPIQCAIHEALHHLIAHALSDQPSLSLRAAARQKTVKVGKPHAAWVEENMASLMTPGLVRLVRALIEQEAR